MKKYFLTLTIILSLTSIQASALNLDKIVGAALEDSKNNGKKSPLADIKNDLVGKVEQRIEKVVTKVENKIDKFEQKFDEYEKKLDKAEKAIDRASDTINNFDSSQVGKYITMAKYAAIGFVSLLVVMVILLVLVFIQLMRVSKLLNEQKK